MGLAANLFRHGRRLIPGASLAAIVGLFCSCRTPPLPCRIGDDFQTQVVYLSPRVAISRHLNVFANETQSFFTLGRVHWEKPERASDTGDRFDDWVRGTITGVGESPDGRWLLVESEDYDWEKHKPLSYATAIQLSTGVLHSANDRAELGRQMGNVEVITRMKLEPVDYFFERQLLARLTAK